MIQERVLTASKCKVRSHDPERVNWSFNCNFFSTIDLYTSPYYKTKQGSINPRALKKSHLDEWIQSKLLKIWEVHELVNPEYVVLKSLITWSRACFIWSECVVRSHDPEHVNWSFNCNIFATIDLYTSPYYKTKTGINKPQGSTLKKSLRWMNPE